MSPDPLDMKALGAAGAINALHKLPALDRALTEADAAAFIGLSDATLRSWRARRQGPPYVRVGGRAVRYLLSDLIEWRQRHRVTPGGGAAGDG